MVAPVAAFTYEPDLTVCGETSVDFTDTSVQVPTPPGVTITDWLWDFGDPDSGIDNTSTQQNPSHTFTQPGVYTVTLTATNSEAEEGSTSQLVLVPAPIACPVALFTYAPGGGTVVDFTDQSTPSAVVGATIVAWSWDFDDDQVEDDATQNPSHNFTAPGEYPVTLTVTDSEGFTDSVTLLVVVFDPNTTTAAFSYTLDVPQDCATQDVIFQDLSQAAVGQAIDSWSWDFGDGSDPSTEQNPTHHYALPGTYSVTLTVTDDDDPEGTDDFTQDVVVPNVALCDGIWWDIDGVSYELAFPHRDWPESAHTFIVDETDLLARQAIKAGDDYESFTDKKRILTPTDPQVPPIL